MIVQNGRDWRKQKGLATVELALLTPFLLLSMLVAGEFTRAFYELNTLNKGVRDAARLMADRSINGGTGLFNMSNSDKTLARNIIVYGNTSGTGNPVLRNLQTNHVTFTQTDLGVSPRIQEHVEVTVNYPFQPLSPVISFRGFLPQNVSMNFTLTATSTMRGL